MFFNIVYFGKLCAFGYVFFPYVFERNDNFPNYLPTLNNSILSYTKLLSIRMTWEYEIITSSKYYDRGRLEMRDHCLYAYPLRASGFAPLFLVFVNKLVCFLCCFCCCCSSSFELLSSMLPVTLEYPFLIASSFSPMFIWYFCFAPCNAFPDVMTTL